MSRFETEVLTQGHNLEGLARMNAQWVDGAMAHTPHRRVILDMDSSESPVHGEQEGAAYNGHFGCVCYAVKEQGFRQMKRRGLMSRKRFIILVIPVLLTLAALACGTSARARSAEPTGLPGNQPTETVTAPELVPITTITEAVLVDEAPVLSVQTPVPEARVSEGSGAIELLDPQEVVAAYEAVLTGIYQTVLPSIVQVRVRRNGSGGRFFGGSAPVAGEGSGFVWSVDGQIVTNHHVIEGADRVMVVFADGTEYKAAVLGSDPAADLAVLQIASPPENLRPVELGDSNELAVGQLAVAIGSPFSQEFSMTRGIVSALGRLLQAGDSNFSNPEVIQTDAPINPGNSGGPLLDRLGRVIGINTQIISRSGSSSGVGFAVPINAAKRVVPELIANGQYRYAYLGISGATVTSNLAEANGLPADTRGVMVIDVVPGSPADRAGFSGATGTITFEGIEYPVGGEVIVGIDGTPVRGMAELLAYMVDNSRPGDVVTLELIYDGRSSRIEVTLGARPDS